jgi:hypothetical protein
MKTTENLSLKQFEGTDNFDYKVLNENFETIDDKITENSEAIDKLAEKTGVEAGSYGGYDTSNGAYNIPNITVNEQGKVTKMSNSVLHHAGDGNGGYLTYKDYSDFKASVVKYKCGTSYDFKVYIYPDDIATIPTPSGFVFPRILNAIICIYTKDSSQMMSKVWIPVQYSADIRNTGMGFYSVIHFEIPEEYREYNINSDGNYEFDYIVEYLG